VPSKRFLFLFYYRSSKNFDAHSLLEYRPISLLESVYKLVVKVLATRLAAVMDSIINPNQSAFHKRRLLVDGVLLVNEVVDFAKRSKNV
jgi:hypothetical protein